MIKLADEPIRRRGYNTFIYTNIARPLHIRNVAIQSRFPAKFHQHPIAARLFNGFTDPGL
jgi:hypothetical protein